MVDNHRESEMKGSLRANWRLLLGRPRPTDGIAGARLPLYALAGFLFLAALAGALTLIVDTLAGSR